MIVSTNCTQPARLVFVSTAVEHFKSIIQPPKKNINSPKKLAINQSYQDMTPGEASNAIFLASKMDIQNDQFWRRAALGAADLCGALTGRQLAELLWGFGKAQWHDDAAAQRGGTTKSLVVKNGKKIRCDKLWKWWEGKWLRNTCERLVKKDDAGWKEVKLVGTVETCCWKISNSSWDTIF